MSTDERRGILYDLDETDYHGDPHSLSVSGMKQLLQAPALFKYRQDNPEHKAVFDLGSAAHRKVLGVGADVVVVPVDDKRGKAWSDARDAAYAEGKTPITRPEGEQVDAMATALERHRLAASLLRDGKPEVSAFWHDEAWNITRRARFDWLRDDGLIVDYKTAATADPSRLAKTCHDFGYHMQDAQYRDVAEGVGIDVAGFAFIFQEKAAPYLVSVIQLDVGFTSLGRARCAEALERYRDCLAADVWPGYADDLTDHIIPAPRWA